MQRFYIKNSFCHYANIFSNESSASLYYVDSSNTIHMVNNSEVSKFSFLQISQFHYFMKNYTYYLLWHLFQKDTVEVSMIAIK